MTNLHLCAGSRFHIVSREHDLKPQRAKVVQCLSPELVKQPLYPVLTHRRSPLTSSSGITHPQTCLNLTGRLRALREAGFRVTLVSSPGELAERIAEREGVEAIALSMQREIRPIADFVSLMRLWWLLLRLRPDVTEFSTPKAGLLGTLAAVFAGVPERVYMLRGLKVEGTTGLKRRVLLLAERVASACAQVVLCNSHSLRMEAIVLGLAPAAKLKLIGHGSSNGVDVERFSPGPSGVRDQLGLSAKVPVLGFVGRLTCDKGLPELMEAFNTILKVDRKRICCSWVGSMPLKTR